MLVLLQDMLFRLKSLSKLVNDNDEHEVGNMVTVIRKQLYDPQHIYYNSELSQSIWKITGGLLEDVPIAIRQEMWWQHEGAPAHHAQIVKQLFDTCFFNRWIRRGILL